MSETTTAPSLDLHDIEALQQIDVQSDIALRPIRQDDAVRLLEIIESDPSIKERVTVASKMEGSDGVAKVIEAMEADPELIRYAITDENDRCIGLVSFWLDPGFFGQDPLPDTYGFGYFLDPDERGRGIITASVNELMAVAVSNIPNIQGFTAFCVDENKDSVAVLIKLGFQPTDNLYPEPDHGWLERQYVRGLENE